MGIYRTYFDKNNTIVKNSDVNTGRNQVSELYFGSSKSRFLFYCSFDEIKALVNSKVINIDGDTRHILKIKNTSNFDIKDFLSTSNNLLFGENYRPTSFDLELHEIKQFWDEGTGYDFMPSPTSIPENKDYALEPSNWLKATNVSDFSPSGAVQVGSQPIATQTKKGPNSPVLRRPNTRLTGVQRHPSTKKASRGGFSTKSGRGRLSRLSSPVQKL